MNEIGALDGPRVTPASGHAPQSIVILLHGYGSNGADLIGLVPYWRDALPDTLFVAPNAPQPCPGAPGGYQWWSLTDLRPESRAAGVRQAAPEVDAFIDAQLIEYRLTPAKLALVGFSQGTMMALHVGPRRPQKIAGIIGYSGMLSNSKTLAAELRSKRPLLLAHGDADEIVPIAAMHDAANALTNLGFDVATHVSPALDHSIDEDGLALGRDFLVRAFGAA
jgi:phospholipase/carboxylesterase